MEAPTWAVTLGLIIGTVGLTVLFHGVWRNRTGHVMVGHAVVTGHMLFYLVFGVLKGFGAYWPIAVLLVLSFGVGGVLHGRGLRWAWVLMSLPAGTIYFLSTIVSIVGHKKGEPWF